ncbi:bacteriophage protein [Mycobacteroides abscessus 6G-0728-R]|nr:bacteriophage protein [Mycobacteroides abscessus 6G-0125-S]EIU99989.1 bacteriophage protein [Mycobacteroides abscessus 6G-0728-R]
MLDAALRWEPGSAIDILTGGSPTPIGTAGSIRDASDMELLAEVQRRMGGGSFPHRDAYDPKGPPL